MITLPTYAPTTPTYAPTTVWEKGQYLVEWWPDKVEIGIATAPGRAVNSDSYCVFAYSNRQVAFFKLGQLKGELEPPKYANTGIPNANMSRRKEQRSPRLK